MLKELLPVLIFLLCVGGGILLFWRRMRGTIPESFQHTGTAIDPAVPHAEQESTVLADKGLPVTTPQAAHKWWKILKDKLYHFILEAEGIRKKSPLAARRLREIWLQRGESQTVAVDPVVPVVSEEWLLEQIKANPKNLEQYTLLGQWYSQHDQPYDAAKVFEYILEHEPNNSSVLWQYAEAAYILRGDGSWQEAALEAAEKSLALDGSTPERFYVLAHWYKENDQVSNARSTIMKALSADPYNRVYIEFHRTLPEPDNLEQ